MKNNTNQISLGQKSKGLGRGQGRGAARKGQGGTEQCECPKCGHTIPHKRSTPCSETKCPKCGTVMTGKFCS